jgi:hypothetical protein
MSPIWKIFIPTDFSPHAGQAFCVAQDLAKVIGASVLVFQCGRNSHPAKRR